MWKTLSRDRKGTSSKAKCYEWNKDWQHRWQWQGNGGKGVVLLSGNRKGSKTDRTFPATPSLVMYLKKIVDGQSRKKYCCKQANKESSN